MATIYGLTKKSNLTFENKLKDDLVFIKDKTNSIKEIDYKIGNFPFPEKDK